MKKPVKNVNSKIAPELVGIEATEQALIDMLMMKWMVQIINQSWELMQF